MAAAAVVAALSFAASALYHEYGSTGSCFGKLFRSSSVSIIISAGN
jgi:hypothetical protein